MTRYAAIVLALLCTSLAPTAFAEEKSAETKPPVEQFTANVISMNAPGVNGSRVQIWIESWTPDDVAQSLVQTLAEKGQTGLQDALADLHVGTIKVGTNSGYPISVARQKINADGTRTIFLATNRPFAGFVQAAGTQIQQYLFGFVKLNLPASGGAGDGTIVAAAQLDLDAATKALSVKGAGTQPGRLSNVKAVKPKEAKPKS